MSKTIRSLILSLLATALTSAPARAAETPDQRAAKTVQAMTADERRQLTHGIMAVPIFGAPLPADAVLGAGFVPGVKRLGVPNLTETDASLGVAYLMGARHDGATALPSGMAQGASFDPEMMRAAGAVIGAEAKAKGFNVMLAGGVNLIREPRGGRTFEYLSEDPLLSGRLGGASIAGIQSNHIVSTVKHYALNGQETARKNADVSISDAAARESDLLAFEIAIEDGQPGSVMCAYNLVNTVHACGSPYLLDKALKKDWGYKGFVMSDWGAVSGVGDAMAGLDQQSGQQLDRKVYFDKPLAEAAAKDAKVAARVDDMARRIVSALYAVGADKDPAVKAPIDLAKNAAVAERAALEGIVLLRNTGVLPLSGAAKSIAVIGGYADVGVLSGAGSSQVQGEGGPSASVPHGGEGLFAGVLTENYHRSSPLKAIKGRASGAKVVYRDGRYVSQAVEAAKSADVAIVFVTQWATEGLDQPDLGLPNGQDALIAAVAAANPHTIVVLETGGPVLTPWLDKTAAVLEAWYPGARGGEAIARILFGEVSPSGRLPVTFPADVAQLPRPKVDGMATTEPDFTGVAGGAVVPVNYDIEGSDVGYRWFARTGARPAFPFGFGLSYTSFSHGPLSLAKTKGGLIATTHVRNTGAKAGADVVQLYLTDRAGKPTRRLAGFQRVELQPGEDKAVQIRIEPRILADWAGDGWAITPGAYRFAIGTDAETLEESAALTLPARRLKP